MPPKKPGAKRKSAKRSSSAPAPAAAAAADAAAVPAAAEEQIRGPEQPVEEQPMDLDPPPEPATAASPGPTRGAFHRRLKMRHVKPTSAGAAVPGGAAGLSTDEERSLALLSWARREPAYTPGMSLSAQQPPQSTQAMPVQDRTSAPEPRLRTEHSATVYDDDQERTGLDVLRRVADRDLCPVLARQQGASTLEEADSILKEGFLWLVKGGTESDERRFCEISGGRLTHRPGRGRSDEEVIINLAEVKSVSGRDELVVLEMQDGKAVTFSAVDSERKFLAAVSSSWRQLLRTAVAHAKEDVELEEQMQSQYGGGLDFLAEGKREEARMKRFNKALFPHGDADGPDGGQQLQEDELFLIQLPATLPRQLKALPRRDPAAEPSRAAVDPRRRSQSAPSRPGAAPPAQAAVAARPVRMPDRGPATSGAVAKRPGEALSGRALGGGEHESSFKDMPPGRIGKIRIHKSGKIKLVIGECVLDVTSAGESNYAQRLVAMFMKNPSFYRAQGWGTQPIRVYREPFLSAQVIREIREGEEVEFVTTASAAEVTNDFYHLKAGGYVLRLGDVGGSWVPIVEQPRAYELGEISRKIIVTPSLDAADE